MLARLVFGHVDGTVGADPHKRLDGRTQQSAVRLDNKEPRQEAKPLASTDQRLQPGPRVAGDLWPYVVVVGANVFQDIAQ